MRSKIAIIVSLWSVFVFGQTQEEVPNYTPPSPDASALTKYGDLPMNEYNGAVSFNLPLYTYTASNIDVPISLNYSGAGVRVNDLPTWVGINWTLNAGGVITRTAKDMPDETAVTRVHLTESELANYTSTNVDGTANAAYLRNLIEHNQIDTEADNFSFSFGNYSGSFFLDEDLNPILVKADSPIKVEVVGDLIDDKMFRITTPDGIAYYFGGDGATEETSLIKISDSTITPYEGSQGVTAFYLSYIEHPTVGRIDFVYNSDNVKIVPIQYSQKLRKVMHYSPIVQKCESVMCCGCPYGQVLQCSNMLPDTNDKTSDMTISTRVFDAKYLYKIHSSFSNEEIIFKSRPVDNANFKRVLDKIIIKSVAATETDTLNKTIDFSYIGFQQASSPFGYQDISKRFFLEKVNFDKDNSNAVNTVNGRRNNVYEFEYNSPTGLPHRFSYAQDYLGFYNGKTDNPSLIPNSYIINPNNVFGFADRQPDFESASMGTLTRIYYPTSGFTKFEYEPAKAKKKHDETIAFHLYRNLYVTGNNKLSDGVPRFLNAFDPPIHLNDAYENQTIDINFTLTAGDPSSSNNNIILPENEFIKVKVTDMSVTPNVVLINDEIIAIPSPSPEEIGLSKTINAVKSFFAEVGHDYKIDISMLPPCQYCDLPFEVNAVLSYYDGYEAVEAGDVRLKRQTDHTDEENTSNIKRYYYSDINNYNPSVDELPLYYGNNFLRTEESIYSYICTPNICASCAPGGFVEYFYFFNSFLSDMIDTSYNSGMSAYEKVTVSYGGDNFEKGGVEKTFKRHDDIGILSLPTQTAIGSYASDFKYLFNLDNFWSSPASPLSGSLIKEVTYSNTNNVLRKISESDYVYDNTPISTVFSLTGSKLYDMNIYGPGTNQTNVISNYMVGQYRLSSFKNELASKTTKQYIDPVPLTVSDESTYKKIITTENYEYNSLRGLPTKITTLNSEGLVNETRNFYPNQASALSGMTAPYLTSYAKLVSQNRVSSPIQVEQYKNGSLLSMQRTLFKPWGTNPEHVFPEKIQSAKGTINLEDRVLFLSYDPLGNPSVVSYPNGKKTKYFYNSFNKVFMKIDNYIETTTGPGSGTMITDTEIGTIESDPCGFSATLPKSQVTLYGYNYTTRLLTSITDPNCKKTQYNYNGLRQLISIKDNDNNIVKEFDNSFKRY